MKLVRFKKDGQKIWRIDWGADDCEFLGAKMKGVWPKREDYFKASKRQRRYRAACFAVAQTICTRDKKGFVWVIERYAEIALDIAAVACTAWKPMPKWAIDAMYNGWSSPEGWTPDSIGTIPEKP